MCHGNGRSWNLMADGKGYPIEVNAFKSIKIHDFVIADNFLHVCHTAFFMHSLASDVVAIGY